MYNTQISEIHRWTNNNSRDFYIKSKLENRVTMKLFFILLS